MASVIQFISTSANENAAGSGNVPILAAFAHCARPAPISTGVFAESVGQVSHRTGGTVSDLHVNIRTNTTSVGGTARLRKGGVNQTMSIAVGAAVTGWLSDLVNSDTVAAGDLMAYSYQRTSGTGDVSVATWTCLFTAAERVTRWGLYAGSSDAVTGFHHLAGGSSDLIAVEATAETTFPLAGTLDNLFVSVSSNSRNGASVYRLRIASGNGNLTLTVNAATTGHFEDLVNSDTVTAGQFGSWSQTIAGSSGSILTRNLAVDYATAQYQPNSNSDFASQGTAGVTKYAAICGYGDPWTTTEATVQALALIDHALFDLAFSVTSNGGVLVLRSRIDGADGNCVITTGSGATGWFTDPVNTDSIATGEYFNYSLTNTGTFNARHIGSTGGLVDAEPSVITRPATVLSYQSARIRGRINPDGIDFTGYFEWGTDPDNLDQVTSPQAIGSGLAFVAYDELLTGLTALTTYYFRAVGENDGDEYFGDILSFTTLGEQLFEDGTVSQPLTWMGFVDRLETTHVFAEVDLNDRADYYFGYKAPWVLGWAAISRALSDRTGQLEHMTFGAVLSDTTRFFRELLDDATNRFLTNRPYFEYMIDDEQRRIEGLPRLVANGYVSDYEPQAPLRFQITGADWLRKKFSRKAKTQRAWQPTITLTDFPNCPQANVGLAAPLIYGRVADDLDGVSGGPVIIPITSGTVNGYYQHSLGLEGPEMGAEWAPPGGFSTPTSEIDEDHRSYGVISDGSPPLAKPTNPALVGVAGGSLNDDWRSATRIIACMVTAIHDGIETDPTEVAVVDLDTIGGDRTARATWTAAAGGANGGYNIYFTDSPYFVSLKFSTYASPFHVGGNFVRVLHVADGVTTVDLTDESDGSAATFQAVYLYQVSAILASGESAPSALIIGMSHPYARPLHLRWLPYTGATGYRIRRAPFAGIGVPPSFDRSYDTDSDGATGPQTIDGITQYEWFDDFTDSPDGTVATNHGTGVTAATPTGQVKPIHVGPMTVSGPFGGGTAHAWLVARGACKNVCRSAFAGGQLIPEEEYGQTIFAPGHAGWPGAPLDYVDINGRRYSLILLQGTRAAKAIDGSEPLTVNVDGFETVGDGSGDLIESLPLQQKHFVRNFLAADSPPDTLWLTTCPTFPHLPSLTLVDETSFDTVAAIWEELNPTSPAGIEGAFVIGANGEFITALDVLAQFHVSGDWNGTFTRRGQYQVSMEPASVDAEDLVALDDVINMVADTFSIRDLVNSEFFNILPYVHTRDYTGRTRSGWYSTEAGEVDVRDTDSITNYDQERESPPFELHMLRRAITGASVIEIVMERKLARYRHPLRIAEGTFPLAATQLEIGEVFRLSHIEGIGASGWSERLVRVTRFSLDPNENRVRLEVYDVEPLIGGSG